MDFLKDKRLFWETNLDTIDPQLHKQYIIERVFERGHWHQWKELVRNYSLTDIKNALQNARSLDAKTMYFASNYFEIPLHTMRCFTQKL